MFATALAVRSVACALFFYHDVLLSTGNDNVDPSALASESFLQEHGFPVEGQIAWPSVFCVDELVYTELSVLANTRKASIIGR